MLNSEERDKLVLRLKKIEGQIRGIQSMIQDRRYCMDILDQTRAVASGVKKVEDFILSSHMRSCVKDSFNSGTGDDQEIKIDEIIKLLSRYR